MVEVARCRIDWERKRKDMTQEDFVSNSQYDEAI